MKNIVFCCDNTRFMNDALIKSFNNIFGDGEINISMYYVDIVEEDIYEYDKKYDRWKYVYLPIKSILKNGYILLNARLINFKLYKKIFNILKKNSSLYNKVYVYTSHDRELGKLLITNLNENNIKVYNRCYLITDSTTEQDYEQIIHFTNCLNNCKGENKK